MELRNISVSEICVVLILALTALLDSASSLCEFTVKDRNKVYLYNLTSPLRKFPHGILSEDGFYKVAANETVLRFQDCGGPSRCGMGCSALVSNKIEGYPICTTLGYPSTTSIDVLDKKNPRAGVIVKMANNGVKHNCSLVVSVACNSNGVQGPNKLETAGFCDYTTEMKHPLGCAKVVSSNGNGLGWFSTLIIIILCLLGVYFLVGAAYRFFSLHVRGIDVIPNLDFWASIPHRVQNLYQSLVRRNRGPSHSYRSSYSPVDF